MTELAPRNAELRMLNRLKDSIALKAMGCQFDRGLSRGACVTLSGNGLGVWWYENEAYNFSQPSAFVAEYSTNSIDEVVAFTAKLASAHFVRHKLKSV